MFGLWMTLSLTSDQSGNVHVEWINTASYILGAIVTCISLMSFVAVTSADCRKAIIPASYLSLIVTILAVATSIAQLLQRSKFNDYLDDEEQAGELSGDDVDTLQFLYILTTFMNMFEVGSSLIRFGGSRAYYNSSVKIDNDFTNTLLAHDRSMDEKYDANRTKVYNKYDGLRDHYRAKYVDPPPSGGGSFGGQ